MSDFRESVNSMATLATTRSLLFAPGGDERKLANALASDAHGVVADLEDAVVPAEKPAARAVVARALAERRRGGPLALLRLNGAGTEWFEQDLALAQRLSIDALVLPKATPEAVRAAGEAGVPVVAIVETAQGLRRAYETASSPRVAALALGAVDLGVELGLEPRADGLELLAARSQLVVDSAAAGIRPPFDAVHLDFGDDEGLEAEARLARSLGFRGKLCIHPAQVPVVNRVFAPTQDELRWARRVLAAYAEGAQAGRGAVALDGSLVDLPVVERARSIIAETDVSGGQAPGHVEKGVAEA